MNFKLFPAYDSVFEIWGTKLFLLSSSNCLLGAIWFRVAVSSTLDLWASGYSNDSAWQAHFGDIDVGTACIWWYQLGQLSSVPKNGEAPMAESEEFNWKWEENNSDWHTSRSVLNASFVPTSSERFNSSMTVGVSAWFEDLLNTPASRNRWFLMEIALSALQAT